MTAEGSTPDHDTTPAPDCSDAVVLPRAALVRLLAWLSPAFPVGAYAWSGGLEWAVEAGDVCDADSLRVWLAAIVRSGAIFADAALLAQAHRAFVAGDDARLAKVADLALALAPSKERFAETTAQGKAFVDAVRAAWPCAALEHLAALTGGVVAYPVAVAAAAVGHGIPLDAVLPAYLHALAANLISSGVRLVPLGQTDGLRVLAALEPILAAAAARALDTPLEAIGSAAFRADLASMRHETQYTRLFRS